jgi:hypothetical protein
LKKKIWFPIFEKSFDTKNGGILSEKKKGGGANFVVLRYFEILAGEKKLRNGGTIFLVKQNIYYRWLFDFSGN